MTTVFTHTSDDEYHMAALINEKATSGKTVTVPRDLFVHLFLDHSILLRECQGRQIFVKYTGPVIERTRDGEERERGGVSRSVRTRTTDDITDLSLAEAVSMAKKLGYVPQPAPNNGVAAMRAKNYIRNHRGRG